MASQKVVPPSKAAQSTCRGVKAPENLLYAVVISRHAQRTPILPCQKLPKKVPEGYGQLTKQGHEQAYKLGAFLRTRYRDFLAADKPGQLLATHVRLDRCRDSINDTLKGLGVAVTPDLDPTRYDLLFQSSLSDNFDAVLHEPARGDFPTMGHLLAFVGEKTGAPTQEKSHKYLALDSLMTHTLNDNPVPSWAEPFWDDLVWADRRIFELALSGHELSFAASVLGKTLETFSLKFEKAVQRPDKMHVFSMSDTSLFSVLKLFNQSYDGRPCFCASIFFELYKEKSNNYVQVLLSTEENPHFVILEKLENPCPLSEFLQFLRIIVSTAMR
ncbi:prostatic acid phosphatase-like [Haemaphysalis longicornis]